MSYAENNNDSQWWFEMPSFQKTKFNTLTDQEKKKIFDRAGENDLLAKTENNWKQMSIQRQLFLYLIIDSGRFSSVEDTNKYYSHFSLKTFSAIPSQLPARHVQSIKEWMHYFQVNSQSKQFVLTLEIWQYHQLHTAIMSNPAWMKDFVGYDHSAVKEDKPTLTSSELDNWKNISKTHQFWIGLTDWGLQHHVIQKNDQLNFDQQFIWLLRFHNQKDPELKLVEKLSWETYVNNGNSFQFQEWQKQQWLLMKKPKESSPNAHVIAYHILHTIRTVQRNQRDLQQLLTIF